MQKNTIGVQLKVTEKAAIHDEQTRKSERKTNEGACRNSVARKK